MYTVHAGAKCVVLFIRLLRLQQSQLRALGLLERTPPSGVQRTTSIQSAFNQQHFWQGRDRTCQDLPLAPQGRTLCCRGCETLTVSRPECTQSGIKLLRSIVREEMTAHLQATFHSRYSSSFKDSPQPAREAFLPQVNASLEWGLWDSGFEKHAHVIATCWELPPPTHCFPKDFSRAGRLTPYC